jgi:hypothetical protein
VNKGFVSINFINGMTERFDIVSDEDIATHPTWTSIENWWMSPEEDSIVYLTIGDTILLLDRAKVTHVKLKPYDTLEIK